MPTTARVLPLRSAKTRTRWLTPTAPSPTSREDNMSKGENCRYCKVGEELETYLQGLKRIPSEALGPDARAQAAGALAFASFEHSFFQAAAALPVVKLCAGAVGGQYQECHYTDQPPKCR